MGKVLTSGASGGVKSDDVTASKWDVVQGKNTITVDSDDEIVEGTLPDIVEDTQCTHSFQYVPDNNYYLDFPQAAYRREDLTEPEKAGGRVFVTLDKLRQDIGYDDPLKVLPSAVIAGQAGTMPTQDGGIFLPSTANQTVAQAQKYMNGDVVLSGDPNFVPGNIRKNSIIFGVKGTFEGWVPEPTDLYYKGVVKDGIIGQTPHVTIGYVRWDLEQISVIRYGYPNGPTVRVFLITKNIDVTSYTKFVVEGRFERVDLADYMGLDLVNPDGSVIGVCNIGSPTVTTNVCSFDISKLSIIKANSRFQIFKFIADSQGTKTYVNRIRLM